MNEPKKLTTREEKSVAFAKAVMDATFARVPHIQDMPMDEVCHMAQAHACAVSILAWCGLHHHYREES